MVGDDRSGAHGRLPKCGAKNRQGSPCAHAAGWGTGHPGQGRCKNHGGSSPSKHGRYSTIKSEALRTLYEQHASDPDPLNIEPELAQCRAIFQDFVERYGEWREALLAWHESYRSGGDAYSGAVRHLKETLRTKDPAKIQSALQDLEEAAAAASGKPTQILDLADAYRILSEITKIVERIERIRAQNAITRPELLRVMAEMGRVVERHVQDEQVLERVKDGWLEIRIA